MRRPLALALLLWTAGPGHAAVWTGTGYVVSGVWVGGGAGVGATSARNSVVSVGQPAVGPRQFTGSYFLRPGFLQSFGTGTPGSGSDPALDQSFSFNFPSGCLQVSVPAGCFSAPYTLSAVVPGFLPDVSSRVSRMRTTGVSMELLIAPTLAPKKSVAVSACYRPQDVAGAVESHLKLAYYPASGEAWVALPTSVDADNDRASAASPHLGFWRLLEQVPSEDLDGVVAYPNPLSPGRGAMTFSRLPAGARLRLYTFSGEKVRELTTDDSGQALWDGANDGGSTVASGTYFVFIEGAGGEKTIKVQVQR